MKRRARSLNWTGAAFIIPAFLIVTILLLYPVGSSIFYSFTNKHLIKDGFEFIGFKNYISVLSNTAFWESFFTSLKWTFLSLVGQILVGFSAAMALNKVRAFKGVYRTLLIIPWAFPSIVIALVWKWMLNGVYGFIPNAIQKLGLSEQLLQFLSDPNLVFGTLVFINIWFGAPLIMVNVLSALQTIPKDQFEAAHIDGANAWQSFWKITFPHIKVVMGLLVVLRTIWVFNNFDIIYLVTGGGPANMTTTVPIYAYDIGWGLKMLGKASAITILLMLFLILVCTIYFKVIKKWEKEAE